MLLQTLLLNIKLNTQINMRSKFNSDLDQLVSLIEKDVRNADYFYQTGTQPNPIRGCVSTNILQDDADCTLSLKGNNVTWSLIVNGSYFIIQRNEMDATNTTVSTSTYPSLKIKDYASFGFFVNSSELDDLSKFSKANILITVIAEPANSVWKDDYGIFPQVRQISVSTRNYEVRL
jgi:hypothetical protein